MVAGGVFTHEDVMHCMELGADGVQVASRFVATEECDASDAYKQAYLAAKESDAQIIQSPVGMPGRAIHNAFLDKAAKGELSKGKCHQCLAKCDPAQIPYCITDALVNAAKGNTEEGLLFCGANAFQAKSLEHVSDIMKEFEEEFSCLQG